MRSLNHRTCRPSVRHHSRMLCGARRPRPTDYLIILCRALHELLKLDKRMRPYIEEQIRLAEHQKWVDSFEPALRAVYGPRKTPSEPLPARQLTRRQIADVIKSEKALAKTQLTLDQLKLKLEKR